MTARVNGPIWPTCKSHKFASQVPGCRSCLYMSTMLRGAAGRADYFGTTLNRAARIFAAAQAGQVHRLVFCRVPIILDVNHLGELLQSQRACSKRDSLLSNAATVCTAKCHGLHELQLIFRVCSDMSLLPGLAWSMIKRLDSQFSTGRMSWYMSLQEVASAMMLTPFVSCSSVKHTLYSHLECIRGAFYKLAQGLGLGRIQPTKPHLSSASCTIAEMQMA